MPLLSQGNRPCRHIEWDRTNSELTDEDNKKLAPAKLLLEVIGELFPGRRKVVYHVLGGGFSGARILHVQALDANRQWEVGPQHI